MSISDDEYSHPCLESLGASVSRIEELSYFLTDEKQLSTGSSEMDLSGDVNTSDQDPLKHHHPESAESSGESSPPRASPPAPRPPADLRMMTLPAMLVTSHSDHSDTDTTDDEDLTLRQSSLQQRTGFRRRGQRRKVSTPRVHSMPSFNAISVEHNHTYTTLPNMHQFLSRSDEEPTLARGPSPFMKPPVAPVAAVSPGARRRSSLMLALSGILSKSQSNLLDVEEEAKSISDHLDRFRLTVNNDNGAPELSCQDWRDLLPQSTIENLDKKDEEQQHLIWELITTERNYIQMLSTVINTLLGSLRHLQSEKYLTKIEEHNVYLNMEKIRQVHLTFWHQCIEPLISTVRDTGELLNPEILASGCNLFEEELNPLFEYVMTYIDSKSYIKTQQTKNSDFKEYINWCSNEIRRQYNKLDLDDVLIKPIQRIQKYPILLKDILRKTTDEDTRSVLTYFLHKVREFVELLNSRKEEKEEQQKIDNIQDRIDGYNLNNTPTHTPNEQLNQILNKYCKFDLTERVPLLNTQRKFIHESHCKMSTVIDGKSSEAVIFIFSDLILVTRPNKNKKNKNKIIKQPLSLDKIEVEELKDYTNTTVFVYSNEYGSLVEMFLLQSVTQESHNTMLNFINQAKDNYTRDKTKFYTEMDISKTSSITSTDPSSTDLPIPRHQPVCGITRSSSEHYPPARRSLLDTSSSVSRAQSMPASNDKRNLVPPKISSAMSSSSSSSSSSGSSSSGLCMDLSRNHTTLPTMDENMRPEDPVIVEPHGNENVISNNNTVQILPVKNIDDVYISENLSSEIKGKLDLEKKFEDEKVRTDDVIFQRSDTIFINHGGDRESKS